MLRRHFDRVEFVENNTSFYFDPDSPLSRSGQANIPPAVLAVEKIVAEDKEKGELLIALGPVLLKEKLAQIKPSANPKVKPGERFSLGKLSDARSKIVAVNNYPENTSLLTEMVYENPAPVVLGDEDVTDSRAISVRVQHTLVAMPDNEFEPRAADYRVGYRSHKSRGRPLPRHDQSLASGEEGSRGGNFRSGGADYLVDRKYHALRIPRYD